MPARPTNEFGSYGPGTVSSDELQESAAKTLQALQRWKANLPPQLHFNTTVHQQVPAPHVLLLQYDLLLEGKDAADKMQIVFSTMLSSYFCTDRSSPNMRINRIHPAATVLSTPAVCASIPPQRLQGSWRSTSVVIPFRLSLRLGSTQSLPLLLFWCTQRFRRLAVTGTQSYRTICQHCVPHFQNLAIDTATPHGH